MSADRSAPARSRWDLVRRRVAPIALVLALLFLATRTCSSEPASARILFGVGAAPIEELRVTIEPLERDEELAFFEQRGRTGPAPVWSLEIAPGSYRLVFVVELRGEDEARRFERRIEVREGAEIRVDLTRDLRPRPPSPAPAGAPTAPE